MMARHLEKRRKTRAAGGGQTRAAKPKPKPKPKPKAKPAAPYHHGSLHDALLKAAETVLERDGLSGLTLRAAAREAGVSHAAPTHHFADLTGLLSELAAAGFRKFGASLATAAASKASAKDRLVAMGEAYVAFARDYPGMFLLMFRSERLDVARPALREAMEEAFGTLTRGVGEKRGAPVQSSSLPMVAEVVRSWALVHGFAMLLLDQRLDHILAHLPEDADARDLLHAVLAER
jgi:AcrR family transcriptional regulator